VLNEFDIQVLQYEITAQLSGNVVLSNSTATSGDFAAALAKYYWVLETKRCGCKSLPDVPSQRACIDKYVITDPKTTTESCSLCGAAFNYYKAVTSGTSQVMSCTTALSQVVCAPFFGTPNSVNVACITTINSMCANQLETLAPLQTSAEFCQKQGFCPSTTTLSA
jgi:hypothetical protein